MSVQRSVDAGEGPDGRHLAPVVSAAVEIVDGLAGATSMPERWSTVARPDDE